MTDQATETRLHLLFSGRVQGVGFRAFVAQHAKQIGICGWVRNVGRRQVEVLAEGTRADLEDFLQAVREGPSVSQVEDVKVEWGDTQEKFNSFKVRWI